MKIGAQLYTVRDFCKTPADLAESLKRVADMGYQTVQLSGTCACDPQWMKEQLAQNGLQCVLTHIPASLLRDETNRVIAEHAVYGCSRAGLGWWSFNEADHMSYAQFLSAFAPVAQKIHDAGMLFMYHNHDQEFKKLDGRLILEKLMEDMPSALMGFTLDTFWVQAGGGDPAQWLERLRGRVPCIHLKDFAYGRKMAVIGEGNINFDRVFEKAAASGTEYMLVEQDDCGGEDPFDCLRRSYDFLRSRGFQ